MGNAEAGNEYVLGALIGSGATGSVYEARATDGELLAVKLLHPHLAAIPEFVARFQREARLAHRIQSSFVAPVRSAGRSGDTLWIAYKRLHGESLDARLMRVRVEAVAAFRPLLEHVLLGLQAAHRVGVVHRDIKPGNVFVVQHEGSERATILDFGIGKHLPRGGNATSQALTGSADVLGTPAYMAPEQAGTGADVDERADLYATAVVGFQALTGVLPFAGDSPMAIIHAKCNSEARTLEAATGELWPKSLETFFRRGMARAPARRFPTAEAMVQAWIEATRGNSFPDASVLRDRLGDRAASPATRRDVAS